MEDPKRTELTDVSYLLDNDSSSLFLKREDQQILGTHKYRLSHALINDHINLHGISTSTEFSIATSGNTGLTSALILSYLGVPLTVFANKSLQEYVEDAFNELAGVTLIKEIDTAIAEEKAILFANEESNVYYLDQYNNLTAARNAFIPMAKEIKEQEDSINTAILAVGTGASTLGCCEVFNTYATTVDDDMQTITGVRNFRHSDPGDVVLSANNFIKGWYKHTLKDVLRQKVVLEDSIGLAINHSTALGMMTAIDHCNDNDNTHAVALCTGLI